LFKKPSSIQGTTTDPRAFEKRPEGTFIRNHQVSDSVTGGEGRGKRPKHSKIKSRNKDSSSGGKAL